MFLRLMTVFFLTFHLFFSQSVFAAMDILGAGATFPYPLYSKVFDDYHKETKNRVNYQAIGSGGGVRQLMNRTVDFGATDAYVSDKSLKKFPASILHIPTCLGAVVITYNLPGQPTIRLSGPVIADIFLGRIVRWDDPRIASLNPTLELPDMMIAVIHRSDGSGTTHVFADFLAKVSTQWQEKVGVGKSLNWPTGLGAKGNPGVANLVKQIPGSIGYCELVYTLQNNMPAAILQNSSGEFIEANLKSVSAAVGSDIPDDLRANIVNTSAKYGYPLASFTWLIVYQEQHYGNRSIDQAKELVKLLHYVLQDGQERAEPLGYAPLSKDVAKRALGLVKTMTYDGLLISQKP